MFLGAALSLPGIAGLLLTLGMAVDANILVNERIREEKNSGKGLLQAVTAGYERAFITILDSNLTTVITAAILYFIGTGPIRGFALTLIIGIFISMFTALYVTRTLFLWGMEKGILTEFRMAPVYLRPEWDWMKLRVKFIGISTALIVAGTVVFALRSPESKYDLEFTGGQRVVVALKTKMAIQEIHALLDAQKIGAVSVRTVRGRGADAEKLNLTTESDSFELTAPIGKLAAEFVSDLSVGEKDKEGVAPVHLVLNFGSEPVAADAAKALVASAPSFAAGRDLAVAPDASRPGSIAFAVDAKIPVPSGKDPRRGLVEQLQEAERERQSSQFTERVRAAFQTRDLLVPPGFADVRVEPPGSEGLGKCGFVLHLASAATPEQVKAALATAPMLAAAKDLKVEAGAPIAGAHAFKVEARVPATSGKDPGLVLEEQVSRAIREHPDLDLSDPVPQSDFIGPGVARTLRDQAMLAVLLSILAQIVYLRVRFRDFTYGIAAAIALIHDVLITLGALAAVDGLGLAHLKINLPVIAAFLTLIGYSMNDTIVVFDRIRENLGRSVHPGSGLINGSINQTLARSIRTSMTVWLVAVVLFAFNMGAASSLEGFAFVMVIGVLTGTYSSVAIASPLLLFLPIYGAKLGKLGRAAQTALFAAMGVGLLLAMATDGASAAAGALMACLLPAHFLWELVRWLPEKDPDALVRGLENATPTGR
jgi:SecD/SecF fusion protein